MGSKSPPSPQSANGAGLVTRALQVVLEHRRVVVVVLHLGLIALSNYLALWLRFDGVVPPDLAAQARALLPLLLLVRVVTFLPFPPLRRALALYQHQGRWQYRGGRGHQFGGVLPDHPRHLRSERLPAFRLHHGRGAPDRPRGRRPVDQAPGARAESRRRGPKGL